MANLWHAARRLLTAAEAVQQQRQLAQDYRTAFATEAGQRVLADLLRRTGLARATMVQGDTHATAFNEGRRSIGLELVRAVNASPDAAERLLRTGEIEELTHG